MELLQVNYGTGLSFEMLTFLLHAFFLLLVVAYCTVWNVDIFRWYWALFWLVSMLMSFLIYRATYNFTDNIQFITRIYFTLFYLMCIALVNCGRYLLSKRYRWFKKSWFMITSVVIILGIGLMGYSFLELLDHARLRSLLFQCCIGIYLAGLLVVSKKVYPWVPWMAAAVLVPSLIQTYHAIFSREWPWSYNVLYLLSSITLFVSGFLYLRQFKLKEKFMGVNGAGRSDTGNKEQTGYTKINIPNQERDKYIDLLRAFECYAKLKGYKVYVSFDISENDILGFRIDIDLENAGVTDQAVRNDLQEFIEKVKAGSDFDDLPYTLSPHEHELINTVLKAKIITLKHELQLSRLSVAYLEKILELRTKPAKIKYVITDSTVTISNNLPFAEIGSKIDEFLKRLEDETYVSVARKIKLTNNLHTLKSEIHRDELDKSKISNLLRKGKSIAEKAVFTHHCEEALKAIWKFFTGF